MKTKTARRVMEKGDTSNPPEVRYVWYRFPMTGLQRLEFYGYGAYPYDCELKRKHPRAAVYVGETWWASPVCNDWKYRVAELDGKEFAE